MAAGNIAGLNLGNLGKKVRGEDEPTGAPAMIAHDDIIPDPNNPRKSFDQAALEELAASVKERGILQPIVLSPKRDGKHMIRYGERRWRAAGIAGLTKVPAIIDASDEANGRALDQVVENEQRASLTNSEMVAAIKLELDNGKSPSQIAKHLGRSRSDISLYTGLIEAPAPIVALVDKISVRAAYSLATMWKVDEAATKDFISTTPNITAGAAAEYLKSLRENQLGKGSDEVRAPAPVAAPAQEQVREPRKVASKEEGGGEASTKSTASTAKTKNAATGADALPVRRPLMPAVNFDDVGAAIGRLLVIAMPSTTGAETGASWRVADFLLAWWNGEDHGDFQIAHFFSLDPETGEDLITIMAYLAQNEATYPDAWGHKADMVALAERWRQPEGD